MTLRRGPASEGIRDMPDVVSLPNSSSANNLSESLPLVFLGTLSQRLLPTGIKGIFITQLLSYMFYDVLDLHYRAIFACSRRGLWGEGWTAARSILDTVLYLFP